MGVVMPLPHDSIPRRQSITQVAEHGSLCLGVIEARGGSAAEAEAETETNPAPQRTARCWASGPHSSRGRIFRPPSYQAQPLCLVRSRSHSPPTHTRTLLGCHASHVSHRGGPGRAQGSLMAAHAAAPPRACSGPSSRPATDSSSRAARVILHDDHGGRRPVGTTRFSMTRSGLLSALVAVVVVASGTYKSLCSCLSLSMMSPRCVPSPFTLRPC